jgi:hypothetical protein
MLKTSGHFSLSWSKLIQSMHFHCIFFHMRFNIILPSAPGYSKWALSLGISTKTLCSFLSSPIHAKWPSYLIVCDLIACIIFGKEYKSGHSSMCTFPVKFKNVFWSFFSSHKDDHGVVDQTLSFSPSLCLCRILNYEKVMRVTDFFFFFVAAI